MGAYLCTNLRIMHIMLNYVLFEACFYLSPSVIIRNESVIIRNEIASCNRLRKQLAHVHGRLTGVMECCLRTDEIRLLIS